MKNLNYALSLCTGEDTRTKKIYEFENYTWATDSYQILIYKNETISSVNNADIGMFNTIKNMAEKAEQIAINKYVVSDLFTTLEKFKKHYEKLECESCDGEGTNVCEHCDSEYDCKECDGKGFLGVKPFGKLVLKRDLSENRVEMDGAHFDVMYLNTLALVCAVIGVKEFSYAVSEKYLYAKLSDGVYFVIAGLNI